MTHFGKTTLYISLLALAIAGAILYAVFADKAMGTVNPDWVHFSSENGDLPVPSRSGRQTASLILDIDKDGFNDFVIGARRKSPSMVWFRRKTVGWEKYFIDEGLLPIEAGGAFYDIDGDGDQDIVMGEDSSGNKVYWWEKTLRH